MSAFSHRSPDSGRSAFGHNLSGGSPPRGKCSPPEGGPPGQRVARSVFRILGRGIAGRVPEIQVSGLAGVKLFPTYFWLALSQLRFVLSTFLFACISRL